MEWRTIQAFIDQTKKKVCVTPWTPEEVKGVWLAWPECNKLAFAKLIKRSAPRCHLVYQRLQALHAKVKRELNDKDFKLICSEFNSVRKPKKVLTNLA